MIMSGWQIYNASPLFDFSFSSSITLGGWLGGALLWHFAAMWLLMVNGLVYVVLGFATGRFRRKLLPITAGGVISDAKAALTGKLSHEDLTKYNYVQKLLYAGIIVVGVLIVLSRLSICKPVQFQYLTVLTGFDVSDSFSAEEMLKQISKFNDGVQAFIFNPNALASTFPESAVTKPFPFNGYYAVEDAPDIDGKDWKFEVRGLVDNKKSWTLDELYKLPQVKQVTRHICVEGWSAIGSWTGTPLRDFLKLVGADTDAKYVWFQCADKGGYNSPLDMATALHPQTQMAFKFADAILPRAYGFPMKIRVPTKLGFKNPKYVISMEVTDEYKGGYWEDQGYNSFSGS